MEKIRKDSKIKERKRKKDRQTDRKKKRKQSSKKHSLCTLRGALHPKIHSEQFVVRRKREPASKITKKERRIPVRNGKDQEGQQNQRKQERKKDRQTDRKKKRKQSSKKRSLCTLRGAHHPKIRNAVPIVFPRHVDNMVDTSEREKERNKEVKKEGNT